MQAWILDNDEKLVNDQERNMAVLTRMGGSATQWQKARMTTGVTTGVWSTWNDLKTDVEEAFKPHGQKEFAVKKLYTMEQGSYTIDKFLANWDAAVSETEGTFGGAEEGRELLRALRKEITEKMWDLAIDWTVPKNIKTTAREIGRKFERKEAMERAMNVRKVERGGAPKREEKKEEKKEAKRPFAEEKKEEKREDGTIWRKNTPVAAFGMPKETREEYANRRAQIKCYNCNRFGHMAKECKKPRQPRQNRGIEVKIQEIDSDDEEEKEEGFGNGK